jgi:ABC-2 type transport system permease protein
VTAETVPRVESARAPRSAAPAWWLVLARDSKELWIGGKALYMVITYSVLLGVVAYVFASNSELSLVPPKEMVFEVMKISIAAAGFVCLIVATDTISGERERLTLEGLLLTPVSRRQICLGKLLAALTPWPAAFAVAVPYWWYLSQGDEAFWIAVRWAPVVGSLLVVGLVGLGLLVSLLSSSNRTSMFVGLGLYLLVLVPTQLPGTAQTGAAGRFLKRVSPMESTFHFLEKIVVNSRTVPEMASFLLAPAVFAVVLAAVSLWYAGRGLRLEPGGGRRLLPRWGTSVAVLAATVLVLGPARDAAAQSDPEVQPSGLEISVDQATASLKAGDPLLFDTTVANRGGSTSPPLIVAMNIINLDSEGDVVDPEDWSPERTQYIQQLNAGQEAQLSWRVNAILAGDYMVYMVLIPEPGAAEASSQPVTSSGIHLVVAEFTELNPGGVLPIVVVVPVLLVALTAFLFWRHRRRMAALQHREEEQTPV